MPGTPMHTAVRRALWVATGLVTLAMLVACGGSDDGDASAAGTGTQTAAAGAPAATETSAAATPVRSGDESEQIARRANTRTTIEATFGPDNSPIAADEVPAGAQMTGDATQDAVLEYLKAHSSYSCRSLARQPGWFRKYFGDGEWQVALSPALENAPSINPFQLEGERAVGVQEPRYWSVTEATGEIVMIRGNPPC